MGLGDEIMATGQAARMFAADRRPVRIVDRNGRTRWSPVFENNPKLTRDESAPVLVNGPGVRPYIAGKTLQRWFWQDWDIRPGEIYLTQYELAWATSVLRWQQQTLIEPHTKVPNGNKSWPWNRWQELVRSGGDFVQVGPPGTRRLAGVRFIETESFRQACAVLHMSRAFVGSEGALHHAAKALGVPAVVLWSEFIEPRFTGYASQTNIRHAGEACGSRMPCHGCQASMARITVDEVAAALKGLA